MAVLCLSCLCCCTLAAGYAPGSPCNACSTNSTVTLLATVREANVLYLACLLRHKCPRCVNNISGWSMYVIFLQGCPSFSHLTLTGGAIGSGPPLAVGAAIACPHRCVINVQVNHQCYRCVIIIKLQHVGLHAHEHHPASIQSYIALYSFDALIRVGCITMFADC